MDDESRQKRLEAFEEACRRQGVPFTVQRRAILETVLGLENHPSADDVYEAVATRAPGVSRTTVYRTLEMLARAGLVTKVSHPGSVARFDPRTEVHHHLVCQHCGQIIDISEQRLEALPIPDTSALGFEVRDFRVHFLGVCRDCREKEERS